MKKIFLLFFLFLFFSNNTNAEYLNDLKYDADNGDAVSQNNLGYIYLYGDKNLGVDPDLDKAIYYLNAAAQQEQVNAMTTIGWFYFTGEFGAEKDDEQAIYWNKRASDLGFTIASYNMGFFYYSGFVGLKQDLTMAKKYWLLSASQWVNSEGLHSTTSKELFDEINQYNPNPTKEMTDLRDFYINLLNSEGV